MGSLFRNSGSEAVDTALKIAVAVSPHQGAKLRARA